MWYWFTVILVIIGRWVISVMPYLWGRVARSRRAKERALEFAYTQSQFELTPKAMREQPGLTSGGLKASGFLRAPQGRGNGEMPTATAR